MRRSVRTLVDIHHLNAKGLASHRHCAWRKVCLLWLLHLVLILLLVVLLLHRHWLLHILHVLQLRRMLDHESVSQGLCALLLVLLAGVTPLHSTAQHRSAQRLSGSC